MRESARVADGGKCVYGVRESARGANGGKCVNGMRESARVADAKCVCTKRENNNSEQPPMAQM